MATQRLLSFCDWDVDGFRMQLDIVYFSHGFKMLYSSIILKSLGPKLPRLHLLMVLHCNGFAMLLK